MQRLKDKLVIATTLFFIYMAILITGFAVPKTVDPIILDGYVDIRNDTPTWNQFTSSSEMIKVTCDNWNKLPEANRDQIVFRYIFFDPLTCNSCENETYQSHIRWLYGIRIFHLWLFALLSWFGWLVFSNFRIISKVSFLLSLIFILAGICVDIRSLVNIESLYGMSRGTIYDVDGCVNISGTCMPIHDQFQLAETMCNAYTNSPVTYMDAYLYNCSIDNKSNLVAQISLLSMAIISIVAAVVSASFTTYEEI